MGLRGALIWAAATTASHSAAAADSSSSLAAARCLNQAIGLRGRGGSAAASAGAAAQAPPSCHRMRHSRMAASLASTALCIRRAVHRRGSTVGLPASDEAAASGVLGVPSCIRGSSAASASAAAATSSSSCTSACAAGFMKRSPKGIAGALDSTKVRRACKATG